MDLRKDQLTQDFIEAAKSDPYFDKANAEQIASYYNLQLESVLDFILDYRFLIKKGKIQ